MLSIVIVNWNSGPLLRSCLASLPAAAAALKPPDRLARVVVVDNGSDDGSEAFDAPAGIDAVLLRNRENRGFAAACNQGAAACPTTDLILFLNPDTRLYAGSLTAPLAALAQPANAHVAIVGIALDDDSGRVATSCARFPRGYHFLTHVLGIDRVWPRSGHYMAEWNHGEARVVDQVIGAFFLMRRAVFDALGGFDERFFVYFEEVDLALRARQAGWSSLFLPAARAYHKGGGSSDAVRAQRLFYSLRSRLQFSAKHHGLVEHWLVQGVTWVLEPMARVLLLAARGRWGELRAVRQAYGWLLKPWRQT